MSVTEQKYKKGRIVFTHYDQAYEIIAPLRYECSGNYHNGPASGWVYECFPVNPHRFVRIGPPCEVWEKQMLPDRPASPAPRDWPYFLLSKPRSAGQSAARDFFLNYICIDDSCAAPSPRQAHNTAVKEVLTQRGQQYTPDPERSQSQAVMNDAIMAALRPLLPADMPPGSDFRITMMVAKLTRAIEGGLNGQYEGDNGLDLSGYEACLAAAKRGILPQEVVQ